MIAKNLNKPILFQVNDCANCFPRKVQAYKHRGLMDMRIMHHVEIPGEDYVNAQHPQKSFLFICSNLFSN